MKKFSQNMNKTFAIFAFIIVLIHAKSEDKGKESSDDDTVGFSYFIYNNFIKCYIYYRMREI